MQDLFVYGTLRDEALRRRVLGAAAPRRAHAAVAEGWMAARLPGAHYPILVAAPEATAEGLVLPKLSSKALGLLKAFEGPGYRLTPISIARAGETERVDAFLPTAALAARAGPPFVRWRYEEWRRSWRGGRI